MVTTCTLAGSSSLSHAVALFLGALRGMAKVFLYHHLEPRKAGKEVFWNHLAHMGLTHTHRYIYIYIY